MRKNLAKILVKDSAFCLNETLNVYLCPTQCIDCSLMRVPHESRSQILKLLLEMRSPNKH